MDSSFPSHPEHGAGIQMALKVHCHCTWCLVASSHVLLTLQGIEPEIRTYNTVIIACNMSGQAQEALKVYERMLRAGADPTATTYTALISAYGKNGQLDRALQIFEDMVSLLQHFPHLKKERSAPLDDHSDVLSETSTCQQQSYCCCLTPLQSVPLLCNQKFPYHLLLRAAPMQ